MKLTFDIKTILIIFFLIISIVFSSLYFFRKSDTNNEVDKLKKENDRLEYSRDSSKLVIKKLENSFLLKQIKLDSLNAKLLMIDQELIKSKSQYKDLNKSLLQTKEEYNKIQKEIEELKKNPSKREGDDLINSLKNKLNNK